MSLIFLNFYLLSSFSFNNNCPSVDVESFDDNASLYKLIEFLEEFSNKRQTLVQVKLTIHSIYYEINFNFDLKGNKCCESTIIL